MPVLRPRHPATLSARPDIARLAREGEPANAVPQGLQGLDGASTLTAGLMILACAGDQPPVPSPARTVGFRVCGLREPTTGHTAPGVITLTPDIERM